MSPDQSKRSPFVNVGDADRETTATRPELETTHGEISRYPEEEADLHEQHVGEVRGPVIGEKGDVDPDAPRVAETLMDFKRPPVRPREVQ